MVSRVLCDNVAPQGLDLPMKLNHTGRKSTDPTERGFSTPNCRLRPRLLLPFSTNVPQV